MKNYKISQKRLEHLVRAKRSFYLDCDTQMKEGTILRVVEMKMHLREDGVFVHFYRLTNGDENFTCELPAQVNYLEHFKGEVNKIIDTREFYNGLESTVISYKRVKDSLVIKGKMENIENFSVASGNNGSLFLIPQKMEGFPTLAEAINFFEAKSGIAHVGPMMSHRVPDGRILAYSLNIQDNNGHTFRLTSGEYESILNRLRNNANQRGRRNPGQFIA